MKKIKLGLIGSGYWGQKYIETVSQMNDCEIVEVRTHDYKNLRQDVDGIIIATPSETHFEILSYFPEKYLLVEKPLTMNYKQALQITSEKIMVGYTFLYDKRYWQFRGLVMRYRIRRAHAVFSNTVLKGNLLWELSPHPISIFIDLFGSEFFLQSAFSSKNEIIVNAFFGKTLCSFNINISKQKKQRWVEVESDIGNPIEYDATIKTYPTPLENQIRRFLECIRLKTSIKFSGRRVVDIISQIESAL